MSLIYYIFMPSVIYKIPYDSVLRKEMYIVRYLHASYDETVGHQHPVMTLY